ncbi:MAG: hypothetical protein ACQETE_13370 [Bacteroidota bacterium]
MKPWQRYGLYLLLIFTEIFSGYLLYEEYLEGHFSFINPFFLNIILAPLILPYWANRTYYVIDQTFVSADPILTRQIELTCVKYIQVDKRSIRLHKIPIILSPVIYKHNQGAKQVATYLDEILLDQPDIRVKGSGEHIEKWFPQTFEARTQQCHAGC